MRTVSFLRQRGDGAFRRGFGRGDVRLTEQRRLGGLVLSGCALCLDRRCAFLWRRHGRLRWRLRQWCRRRRDGLYFRLFWAVGKRRRFFGWRFFSRSFRWGFGDRFRRAYGRGCFWGSLRGEVFFFCFGLWDGFVQWWWLSQG